MYVPLLLSLGVVSCAAVVWIARRMDVVDHEGHPIQLGWRALVYWVWLGIEIVKSNISVARLILDPKLPIHPVLVTLKAGQQSELGQVIYANSITLTPGTVSIRIDSNTILVHAVAKAYAEDLESGEMDRRVTGIEGSDPPQLLGSR